MDEAWAAWHMCMVEGNTRGARKWARKVYPKAWFPVLKMIREMLRETARLEKLEQDKRLHGDLSKEG